jgi:hypothetical protein
LVAEQLFADETFVLLEMEGLMSFSANNAANTSVCDSFLSTNN